MKNCCPVICSLVFIVCAANVVAWQASHAIITFSHLRRPFTTPSIASISTKCTSNSDDRQHEHSSGRRWKNRRKNQIFRPSPERDLSRQEEKALLAQLGYIPSNVCRVSSRSLSSSSPSSIKIRCQDDGASQIDTSRTGTGRPIAIQSYPLLVQLATPRFSSSSSEDVIMSTTPFPTLYWLTCPHVSRAISELERQGWVRSFQSRLESSSNYDDLVGGSIGEKRGKTGDKRRLCLDAWMQCHEEYANERWALLSDDDRNWLMQGESQNGESNGSSKDDQTQQRKILSMREMIQYSGVAGTDHRGLRQRQLTKGEKDASLFIPSVKCLHSHYAHYRSQLSTWNVKGERNGRVNSSIMFNPVGEWTHELLLNQFPDLVL